MMKDTAIAILTCLLMVSVLNWLYEHREPSPELREIKEQIDRMYPRGMKAEDWLDLPCKDV